MDVFGRLRERLAGLGAVWGLGTVEERRLLDRRAQRLARTHRRSVVEREGELAIFTRQGVRYGVAIDDLLAIEPLTMVTPVPGVDRAVAGVVHRLGRIHTVLDLAVLLTVEGRGAAPQAQALSSAVGRAPSAAAPTLDTPGAIVFAAASDQASQPHWVVFVASGTIAVGLLADELLDIVPPKPASRAALGGLPERVLPAIRGVTEDLLTVLEPAGLVTEEIVGARPGL